MSLTAVLALALALATGAPPPVEGPWLPELPVARQLSDRDRVEVTRAYRRADQAFARRRFAEALRHAERAFELAPNASTALIRATILGQLDRPREATLTLLVARDLRPTEAERATIEAALDAHARALDVVWLELRADPADAAIALGGALLSGPRTVALPAGRHAVGAVRPGRQSVRAVLAVDIRLGDAAPGAITIASAEADGADADRVVAVGSRATVTLALAPEVAAVVASEERPEAHPDRDEGDDAGEEQAGGGIAGGWVLVGSGLGVIAVGIVTHILAVGEADEATGWAHPQAGVGEATRRARYDAAVSAKDSLETASWVLYGLGAAATVTGVVLLVLDEGSPTGRGDVEVAPWLAPGAVGLTLDARF